MDDFAYAYVRLKLRKLTGIDLDHYKSAQVQRRLQALLEQSGYPHWPAYFRACERDPQGIDTLRNYLGINVSAFFRDPEKWQYMEKVVLPHLLHGHSTLRIWSAGCSRGQEPYSLAVLLAEMTSPYSRHTIVATDIDGEALAAARAGGPYLAEEAATMPALLRERYLAFRDGRYWFTDKRLQRKVLFADHNLLAEPFVPPDPTTDPYDLILCRNVVIYFTSAGKQRLYQRLTNLLRPGGVLFVGSTEILPAAASAELQPLEMSFYQKALSSA
jgi:chemotaxis protein methyltransferase CheR